MRYNVESWWPTGNPVGTGNLASENCLWNGTQGNVADPVGFTASGNVVANPGYSDRSAADFALRRAAPCAGFGPGGETRSPRRPRPPPPADRPSKHDGADGLRHNPGRLRLTARGRELGAAPRRMTYTYTWERC